MGSDFSSGKNWKGIFSEIFLRDMKLWEKFCGKRSTFFSFLSGGFPMKSRTLYMASELQHTNFQLNIFFYFVKLKGKDISEVHFFHPYQVKDSTKMAVFKNCMICFSSQGSPHVFDYQRKENIYLWWIFMTMNC
jgi:hypothetical protein